MARSPSRGRSRGNGDCRPLGEGRRAHLTVRPFVTPRRPLPRVAKPRLAPPRFCRTLCAHFFGIHQAHLWACSATQSTPHHSRRQAQRLLAWHGRRRVCRRRGGSHTRRLPFRHGQRRRLWASRMHIAQPPAPASAAVFFIPSWNRLMRLLPTPLACTGTGTLSVWPRRLMVLRTDDSSNAWSAIPAVKSPTLSTVQRFWALQATLPMRFKGLRGAPSVPPLLCLLLGASTPPPTHATPVPTEAPTPVHGQSPCRLRNVFCVNPDECGWLWALGGVCTLFLLARAHQRTPP